MRTSHQKELGGREAATTLASLILFTLSHIDRDASELIDIP
jgi:hypothetical protein